MNTLTHSTAFDIFARLAQHRKELKEGDAYWGSEQAESNHTADCIAATQELYRDAIEKNAAAAKEFIEHTPYTPIELRRQFPEMNDVFQSTQAAAPQQGEQQ
jgi:hypothetical protein